MNPNRNVENVVWPWRDKSGAGEAPTHSARKRVLVQGLVAALVACIFIFWLKKHTGMGLFLSGVALFFAVAGLIGAGLPEKIDKFGKWLGYAVGQFLTYILLVPFFIIFMLPARLILLLNRKDPMSREFLKSAGSYWSDRRKIESKDYFKRQF